MHLQIRRESVDLTDRVALSDEAYELIRPLVLKDVYRAAPCY